jgi:hypothetical protein
MTEKDKIEIPVKRGKEKVRNRKRGTYERGRHREGEGRDIGCQVKGGRRRRSQMAEAGVFSKLTS